MILTQFSKVEMELYQRYNEVTRNSPSYRRGGADNYLTILLAIASYSLETLVSISSCGPGYPLSLRE